MSDAPAFNMRVGPPGTASGRYASGKSSREPYLRRARNCAALTIPFLFRPEGDDGSTDEEIPWNSGGALLLSNMAAKLILAMFGIGVPPMKLKPGKDTQASLLAMAASDPDAAGELAAGIDLGLSGVEQEFVEVMEEDGDRAKLAVAGLKLLCGGNHGFQFRDDGTMRGIALDRFVVWRDKAGNLLEFVVEDILTYETLPDDIRAHVLASGYQVAAPGQAMSPISLYTRGYLQGGVWQVAQECYGKEVEATAYKRTPEALEFFFCPWQLLEGEHYGRSYVEHFLGDLQSVEGIAQTVQESAAAIAKFLTLVDPTGLTSKKVLAQAANGAIIAGRKDDVHVVENSKGGDLQYVMGISDKAEKRLERAFLATSAIQRQGERVTATEMRILAGELEDAQAGAYSQQVVTWQQPYVRLKLFYAMKQKRVTPLPMGSVKVTIVGGMGGLARNAELSALDNLVAGLLQTFGPEGVVYLNKSTYLKRRAAALGIKTDGLIYSDEKIKAEQQEQQQQQLIQTLGPEAMKQVGQNITSNQVADTNAAARQPAQLPAPAAEQGA